MEKIDPSKLSSASLALLLTNAGRRRVTEEQVRQIAEAGNLLSSSETINLIQYAAFLAAESGEKHE
ncbi:MAG: hypothetical protein LBT05_10115 [Planctomycetaceae bacterium]|jgi:hypothetical protein|nr:hypothetical protein [Planctomycetaceae bacterium]